METLIGTYAAVAIVVGLYAAWMGVAARRLSRRLKELDLGVQIGPGGSNQVKNFVHDAA